MIFSRMFRAAKLESALYSELAMDPIAMAQAIAVIAMATLLTVVAVIVWGQSFGEVQVGEAIGRGILLMPMSWLLLAMSAFVVGGFMQGAAEKKGDRRHLLTAIGFAASPAMLYVFLFIPGVNALVEFIVPLWLVIATAMAVKVVLGVSFMKGLMAVGPGLLASIIIGVNAGPAGGS